MAFFPSTVAVNEEMTFLCRFLLEKLSERSLFFLYLLHVICSVLRQRQWFTAAKNSSNHMTENPLNLADGRQ